MTSLGLEKSFCLSIPPTRGRNSVQENVSKAGKRLAFVSETDVLHAAGNALQIRSLTGHAEPSAFAWADLGRGFSCFDVNPSLNLVAYSPRGTKPDILVRSLLSSELVCTLTGGAHVEYADVSLSRDGTRVAAVGRGGVDSKLWVWQIVAAEESSSDSSPTGKLLATRDLEYSSVSCQFNPCDNDEVAVLGGDGSGVVLCRMSHVMGKEFVTTESKCLASALSEHDHITAFAWASRRIMLGTSKGFAYSFEKQGLQGHIVITCPHKHGASPESPVKHVLVTTDHFIVGYANGIIQWRTRFGDEADATEFVSNVDQEVNIGSNLIDLACSPEAAKLVAMGSDGSLYSFSAQINQDSSVGNGAASSKPPPECLVAKLQESIIISHATLLLAGKAGSAVLLSGCLDGRVRACKEPHISSTMCIASMDLGSPVTCLVTLEGSPVFAAGCANGTYHIVHVARDMSPSDCSDGGLVFTLLRQGKLCDSPLRSMVYNATTKKIAAGCSGSLTVFVICCSGNNLNVIGVVEISKPFAASTWSVEQPSHLLIGDVEGNLSCVNTTSMCFKPEPVPPLWSCQLVDVANLKTFVEMDGFLYVAHDGVRGIDCFSFPAEMDAAPPTCIKRSHRCHVETQKDLTTLFSKPKLGLLISGSLAGEITVFKATSDGELEAVVTKTIHSDAVISISFSANGCQLYSSAADASFFVHSVSGCDDIRPTLSTHEYDYLISKGIGGPAQQEPLGQEEHSSPMPMRQLEPAEDLGEGGEKEHSQEIAAEQCNMMETNTVEIQTISEGTAFIVSNFPLRIVSDDELRLLSNIKSTRLCEMKEGVQQGDSTSAKTPAWASSILDPASGLYDHDDDSGPDNKDGVAASLTDAKEEECSVGLLFYSPLEVRTDAQRKTQIVLLEEAIRVLTRRFNDRFDTLRLERESVLAQINAANSRIQQMSSKSARSSEGSDGILEHDSEEGSNQEDPSKDESISDLKAVTVEQRLEMESLRSQVQDLATSFNDEVRLLYSEKQKIQSKVLEKELYLAHLANTVFLNEDISRSVTTIEARVKDLELVQKEKIECLAKLKSGQEDLENGAGKVEQSCGGKTEKEAEIKTTNDGVKEMKISIEHASTEEREVSSTIATLQKELDDKQEEKQTLANDPVFLISIKAGQDRVKWDEMKNK